MYEFLWYFIQYGSEWIRLKLMQQNFFIYLKTIYDVAESRGYVLFI